MTTDLAQKSCTPCEGGTPALGAEQVAAYRPQVPAWAVTPDGRRLRREWKVKDFAAGLDLLQRVGALAEGEDHHPDLHLTDYRRVAIELWTHAAGGLTENDFILAAKIDTLPAG